MLINVFVGFPLDEYPIKTFAHYYSYFELKVLQTLEYFLKLPLDIFSKQQIK